MFCYDGLGNWWVFVVKGDCCEYDRCNFLIFDEMMVLVFSVYKFIVLFLFVNFMFVFCMGIKIVGW